MNGAIAHLKLKNFGYHYLIEKAGKVHKLVDEEYRASHASFANRGTIGIALVGGGIGGALTKVQQSTLEKLVEDIQTRYPVQNLMGHRHVKLNLGGFSSHVDPQLPESFLKQLAERRDLKFDSSGQATRLLNQELQNREVATGLSCAFNITFNAECATYVETFLRSSDNKEYMEQMSIVGSK